MTYGTQVLELPLRGLGGEQAERRVAPVLRDVPGVLDVQVHAASFRLRVTYDPARTSPEALHAVLHDLGVGVPHPSNSTRGGPQPG